jgi:hypothetical protein
VQQRRTRSNVGTSSRGSCIDLDKQGREKSAYEGLEEGEEGQRDMKREEEEDKPLRNVADRTVLVGLHSENGGDGLVVGDTTGSVCSI